MDSISKFVEHVVGVDFIDLPQTIIDTTKNLLIDTIGVGIAGVDAPGCNEALQLVKGWGGRKDATVLFQGFRCPAPWAAFVNSIAMHALDFDDTLDKSAHHANVSVLPAALAAAEVKGETSGRDLIVAVALGHDISIRLALSLTRPLAWTRAATCGFFGATAAVGKILGLDRENLWNAFGLAYCQTAGNVQGLVDGALSKRMQPAFAAKNAILSSLLAEKGVTGPKNVLEGDYGFFKLYEHNDYDKNILLRNLGAEFTGEMLSTKPYPCCRMTHSSIDLALSLRNSHNIDINNVEKITVFCSKMVNNLVGQRFELRDNYQTDAQFSIPYTVIIALIYGDVFLQHFETEFIKENAILNLTERVQVVVDNNIEVKNMMKCSMEVKTIQGDTYVAKTEATKGNPLNPMSTEECMDKFRKCASYGKNQLAPDRISEILKALRNLEKIPDIRRLTSLLF
ncbi:MAG: MmgE/PrpD family protein [Desulfobacterium sp.]|nr:MmgE/PrpD family protein [Desulfobacterium sp.]